MQHIFMFYLFVFKDFRLSICCIEMLLALSEKWMAWYKAGIFQFLLIIIENRSYIVVFLFS